MEGVVEPPEFFADLAASWVDAQLARPLERSEWLRGPDVVASRTRLVDTGLVIVQRGSWLRRRRPPDRTVHLP